MKQAIPYTTVSAGTLRTQDLLRSFANTLEDLDPTLGESLLIGDARNHAMWLDDEKYSDNQIVIDNSHEIVGELEDHLNRRAPEGYWFGAHEGDGALFGFWQLDMEND